MLNCEDPLKGRQKTGKYGFAVPTKHMDDLVIEVSDYEHDPALFSGSVNRVRSGLLAAETRPPRSNTESFLDRKRIHVTIPGTKGAGHWSYGPRDKQFEIYKQILIDRGCCPEEAD
jgi:hypothetical protein